MSMSGPQAPATRSGVLDRDAGWSIDVRAMFRPAAVFTGLAERPAASGAWTLLRRPVLVAAVLGCSMSLLTHGYLSPGLAASSAIAWCYVPLAEIAGLAVAWRAAGRAIGWPRAVDLFFAGHAPWLFWMILCAGFWIPAADLPSLHASPVLAGSMLLILMWSAYIDLQFFRHAAGFSRPVRYLLLQRCVTWGLFLGIFGGGSLWPGLMEELGLR